MKKTFAFRTLLGLALMGAVAAAPLTTSIAQAQPGHGRGDVRRDDDDNRGGRRDFDGRSDGRRGGRDRDGRDDNGPGRGSRLGESSAIVPKFVGVVTKVKSDREFDIRMDDKTYNVYLDAPAARVTKGQTVQLDGERIGNNDIRSASLLGGRRR